MAKLTRFVVIRCFNQLLDKFPDDQGLIRKYRRFAKNERAIYELTKGNQKKRLQKRPRKVLEKRK